MLFRSNLMLPVSADGLERWQVDKAVGSVRNNAPELAGRLPEALFA